MGEATTEASTEASTPPAVPAPPRHTVGVVRRTPPPSPPARFSAAPRYPAMFHVAGGRLVWDGSVLRLVRGDGTAVEPTGRPVVTVTGDGRDVAVTWSADHTGPVLAAGTRATRVVLLERSSLRFAQFARNLAATRPGSLVLDDRTVPSARVPHLAPERPGTARRPGVFARALWRVVGRTPPPGTDGAPDAPVLDPADALVGGLERLAALHRTGDLTDTEYAHAKARILA
ncbi:SHOCT domain-containing protein [Cellulosimicrobium terreum]|nr:SHOCT domain-containing protein [Cellulosimicrobium terreum]